MLGVQAQQHDGFLLPVCCSSLFEMFEKLFACDRLAMLGCPLCAAVPGTFNPNALVIKCHLKKERLKATNIKTTSILMGPIFVVG